MTVYIVHRDVDYEFGEVMGVYSTLEKAREKMRDVRAKHSGDFSIEEWVLDGEFVAMSPTLSELLHTKQGE